MNFQEKIPQERQQGNSSVLWKSIWEFLLHLQWVRLLLKLIRDLFYRYIPTLIP